MDMIFTGNENEEDNDDENNENNEGKKCASTPFEILRSRMVNVMPNGQEGVIKRVIESGSGLVIPIGSRVRGHCL